MCSWPRVRECERPILLGQWVSPTGLVKLPGVHLSNCKWQTRLKNLKLKVSIFLIRVAAAVPCMLSDLVLVLIRFCLGLIFYFFPFCNFPDRFGLLCFPRWVLFDCAQVKGLLSDLSPLPNPSSEYDLGTFFCSCLCVFFYILIWTASISISWDYWVIAHLEIHLLSI